MESLHKFTPVLQDPYGNRLAEMSDVIELDFARQKNQIGQFSMTVPGYYDPTWFLPDSRVEMWRSTCGAPAELDGETCWFIRKIRHNYINGKIATTELSGHDTIGLIARRIVPWYAANNPQYASLMQGDPAGMLARMAEYNWGEWVDDELGDPLVTVTNGGIPPAVIRPPYDATVREMPIEIIPNASFCNVTQDMAWQNLLDVMQRTVDDAAPQGCRICFDIVYEPTGIRYDPNDPLSAGGGTFTFRVWNDARNFTTATFSPLNNTVAEGSYVEYDYEDECTFVYIGGPGQNDSRIVQSFAPNNVGDFIRSPFYPIECWTESATDTSDSDVIEGVGRAEYWRKRPRQRFFAEACDTETTLYGRDYNYGDQVIINLGDLPTSFAASANVDSYRVTQRNGVATVTVPLASDLPVI